MNTEKLYIWPVVENIVTIGAIVLLWWLVKSPWALLLMFNLNTPKFRKVKDKETEDQP